MKIITPLLFTVTFNALSLVQNQHQPQPIVHPQPNPAIIQRPVAFRPPADTPIHRSAALTAPTGTSIRQIVQAHVQQAAKSINR